MLRKFEVIRLSTLMLMYCQRSVGQLWRLSLLLPEKSVLLSKNMFKIIVEKKIHDFWVLNMADTPIRSYTKFTEDMFNKQHIMLMNAEPSKYCDKFMFKNWHISANRSFNNFACNSLKCDCIFETKSLVVHHSHLPFLSYCVKLKRSWIKPKRLIELDISNTFHYTSQAV